MSSVDGHEPVVLFELPEVTSTWSAYRQARLLVDRTTKALEDTVAGGRNAVLKLTGAIPTKSRSKAYGLPGTRDSLTVWALDIINSV